MQHAISNDNPHFLPLGHFMLPCVHPACVARPGVKSAVSGTRKKLPEQGEVGCGRINRLLILLFGNQKKIDPRQREVRPHQYHLLLILLRVSSSTRTTYNTMLLPSRRLLFVLLYQNSVVAELLQQATNQKLRPMMTRSLFVITLLSQVPPNSSHLGQIHQIHHL